MVLNSFISGFRDLIVTPSVALMNSPTDPSRVGIGVAKGTLSLFSHSTSGFFGFASKVSAEAAKGFGVIFARISHDGPIAGILGLIAWIRAVTLAAMTSATALRPLILRLISPA